MSPDLVDSFRRLWETPGPAAGFVVSALVAGFAMWIIHRQGRGHERVSQSIVSALESIGGRLDKHDEKEEERHRETLRSLRDDRRRPR